MSWGLFWFSKLVVVSFPPISMTSLLLSSKVLYYQYQEDLPLVEQVLSPIGKLLVTAKVCVPLMHLYGYVSCWWLW